MFTKVLIANRGEIALRVIEACHQLGVQTVAVFSEPDRGALHVRMADEAYCIGPADPGRSYLNLGAIMSAAEVSRAQAIHPGYGFLAEDPHFVEVCEESKVKFIGPPQGVMRRTGDKWAARQAASAAGVPVVDGSGLIKDEEALDQAVEELGYPLILKAVAGGGGRGMRVVRQEGELLEVFHAARREAESAFGRGDLYAERLLEDPRHVEVQVLADEHGHVVHWGDRDCSVQRRYQKLIEEAPAPGLDPELQEALREAAVKVARALDYTNAGTVEFLVQGDRFYFIEMNARIQVEHPVSEMLVRRDLIVEQIRIAAGEPLGYAQQDIRLEGHALECRINAEDPDNGFLPSTGILSVRCLPGGCGVRWDSAVYDGMPVTPHYDSLLAKLITWGPTREAARLRMIGALRRLRLEGVRTTRELCQEVVAHPDFAARRLSTGFLEGIQTR